MYWFWLSFFLSLFACSIIRWISMWGGDVRPLSNFCLKKTSYQIPLCFNFWQVPPFSLVRLHPWASLFPIIKFINLIQSHILHTTSLTKTLYYIYEHFIIFLLSHRLKILKIYKILTLFLFSMIAKEEKEKGTRKKKWGKKKKKQRKENRGLGLIGYY